MSLPASNERTLVRHVCTAYESGFGHGADGRDLGNPYVPLSSAWEAYQYGHEEGLKRRSSGETPAPLGGYQPIDGPMRPPPRNPNESTAEPPDGYDELLGRLAECFSDDEEEFADISRMRARLAARLPECNCSGIRPREPGNHYSDCPRFTPTITALKPCDHDFVNGPISNNIRYCGRCGIAESQVKTPSPLSGEGA